MTRRKWLWLAGGVGTLAIVAAVAFGWFGVHTAFIDDEVDEAGPVFDSGVAADDVPAVDGDDDPAPDASEGTDDRAGEEDDGEDDGGGETDEPAVMTLASGTFDGVGRYSGEGTAVVLTDGTDQRFVRFEDDFSTSNGPDLFVYLGTGSEAYGDPEQYIELGTLQGNIGSQNYEIPPEHPETGRPIELDHFDHVAVWCERFDATFAVAPLS